MTARRTPHFGRGLFEFLNELKMNNNRAWFNANKQRYVAEVEEPLLRFIVDYGTQMEKISKNFVADPRRVGGSMFRIYRDTRFSKDKSPFKLTAGARFPHQALASGRSVPGFYLHLEPGLCVGRGGIYHPDVTALEQIPNHIVANPRAWAGVLRTKIYIEGDTLKRPPIGFDPEHRFIEDIKRKDFYSMIKLTKRQVCAPDFLDTHVNACIQAAPLVEFLTRALRLQS